MVGRLAGQVADALPVLQDQHAVAIETSNHRPRRRRPKAPAGHAGLAFERRADRHLELFRQLLAGEHGGRLIDIELAARVGADRSHFLKVQIRIDPQLPPDCRQPPSPSLRRGATNIPWSARTGDTCRASALSKRNVPSGPDTTSRLSSSRTTVAPAMGSPDSEFSSLPCRTAVSCAEAEPTAARSRIDANKSFIATPSQLEIE